MFRQLADDDPIVTIFLDGEAISARAGEPVAMALLRHGISSFHDGPKTGPRGPYCMMGVCYDCILDSETEKATQSCQLMAEDGMKLFRHHSHDLTGDET